MSGCWRMRSAGCPASLRINGTPRIHHVPRLILGSASEHRSRSKNVQHQQRATGLKNAIPAYCRREAPRRVEIPLHCYQFFLWVFAELPKRHCCDPLAAPISSAQAVLCPKVSVSAEVPSAPCPLWRAYRVAHLAGAVTHASHASYCYFAGSMV